MPPRPYGPAGVRPAPYGPPMGRMPYGPPPGRPPGGGRGGAIGALIAVVVVVVAGALVRLGLYTAIDHTTTSVAGPYTTYPTSTTTPGVAETGNNPVLADPGTALSQANCPYASWSTQVDQARKFFESAAACLATAWKPVLAKANLPFNPPVLSVTASTTGLSTPCTGSTSNFAAFYCNVNQTIYIPLDHIQTDVIGNRWERYLSVFAHEYGHHVQQEAGILSKAHEDEYDAGVETSKGMEVSRRIELQAQCFDGMYLAASAGGGSLTSSQITMARKDAYSRGDDDSDMRDHGTNQHSGDWFSLGYDRNNTARCNTYTASSSQVS
ncbi:neutral zinc metallopeptidase [Nocardia sp. CA2R105]|uniref:neutral zinc metallopeptidase n=1 Tax=Nocardia coffeae TaxID=2873381 RepID=UPI001CA77980|nr:neutral zinc metallopeptidase [Nocardia coffeae]MBY8855955.1 neutral zinc metallopeptidase [Nocardia coffeae]